MVLYGQFHKLRSTGMGQKHFSKLGDNMASVTWATKVSTNWVDQIDQLTDIFEEDSIFVVWLGGVYAFDLAAAGLIELDLTVRSNFQI